jgi:dihydroorotate dehydrogenase
MFKYKLIGFLYRNVLKRVFFKFDPETVHDHMLKVGHILGKFALTRKLTNLMFNYEDSMLTQIVSGLKFRNPVGLSAGFDKNGTIVEVIPEVGFGFMELGSITNEPYEGNRKPRLVRLPKSKALVVYYGLMNIGVRKFVERLKKYTQKKAIVGISVAKTNCSKTAEDNAGIQDYYDCLEYLEKENVGDYYTINISCPNTFGGEPFTTEERLNLLLSKIDTLKITKPVFIKMPINLPQDQYDQLINVAIKFKITGVIIGNLTKIRDPKLIKDEISDDVKGGISGLPTQELSNNLISYTYRNYKDRLIIIGVGGIFSAEDAYEKIKRGASLLQLITGMIYEGPQLIGEINKGLVGMLKRDGYKNISEAVGTK